MADSEHQAPSGWSERKRKVVLGGIAVVVAIVGYLIGAAVIPRWWSHRVGSLVDDRLSVGTLAGLLSGAAFTFLPLLALWGGVRFRRGTKRILPFLILTIALALPNLFLLGIVLGTGNAAHAGERTLDVEAPGFRGASLVGAVVGGLGFLVVLYLALSRNASRRKARRLGAELSDERARDEG